jgi:hypothetical protein
MRTGYPRPCPDGNGLQDNDRCQLISEYAYTTLAMHRLSLRIPAENTASAAALRGVQLACN